MLYPAIAPHANGMMRLDEIHQMYWETSGQFDGFPVLYLHGGPGDGCVPMCRQLFDPTFYRAVLFDQRGSGRSIPRGELTANRTDLLVQDIERLREMLGIERWLVFGGSWGSTLALVYAQMYPERVSGLILRGIFLGRPSDIEWFMRGMGRFFPEAWTHFIEPVAIAERDDLLGAYYRLLTSSDPAIYLPACQAWGRWEAQCVALSPCPEAVERESSIYFSLPLARIEAHYFIHQLFLQPDQLLQNIHHIAHLPAYIVQGRYDVICPPDGAFTLAAVWPQADLCLVEAAGHSMWEPAVLAALLDRLERFKSFLTH